MEETYLNDGEISLKLIRRSKKGQASSGFVPIYYFHICRLVDGQIVGQCDLRVGHNEAIQYAGHLGYSVLPKYRGNHYAAKACYLLFALAREQGLDHVLITCNPDNLASRRVCQLVNAQLVGVLDVPDYAEDYALGNFSKCQYRVQLSS